MPRLESGELSTEAWPMSPAAVSSVGVALMAATVPTVSSSDLPTMLQSEAMEAGQVTDCMKVMFVGVIAFGAQERSVVNPW